eukprot:gene16-4267_t
MSNIGLSRLQLQTGMFEMTSVKFILGLIAMTLIVILSSFSNVYYEFITKNQKSNSIFLQNFYLFFYGVVINFVIFFIQHPNLSSIFNNYNVFTFISIFFNSIFGILVLVILKHLNNIYHIFISSLSVILVSIANFIFFNGSITPHFLIALIMIISSLFIYFLADNEEYLQNQGSSKNNYELANQSEEIFEIVQQKLEIDIQEPETTENEIKS